MLLWRRVLIMGLVAGLAGVGCQNNAPTAPTATTPKASRPAAKASPSPSPSVAPTGGTAATPAPIAFYGRVFDAAGKPAAGVKVTGYLIGHNGAGVIGNNGSSYRLAQAGGETALPQATTDDGGYFKLTHPNDAILNVEAVADKNVKAIAQQVVPATTGMIMRLAKTGTITGKVVSASAGVTNVEGVDVYIPGTAYAAKTSAAGTFTLENVPESSYTLVATKLGLGRGEVRDVTVDPDKTTIAPELKLAVTPPVLTAVSPTAGLPGTEVTLTGEKFGASTGEIFTVTFGGATASAPNRVDDNTITVKVPASAKTGDVVVTVNGIPGNAKTFNVVKSVAIAPRKAEILLGKTFQYTASGKDADDKPVENVAVDWNAEGAAFSVDTAGLVTARAVGEGKLTIAAGTLTDALTVSVVKRLATVTTFAGDGAKEYADGTGAAARFGGPSSLVSDTSGNLYVMDYRRLRKVTAAGAVTSLSDATKLHQGTGLALKNDILVGHLAIDGQGQIYLSDDFNGAVVKMDASGNGTLVANLRDLPGGGHPSGVAVTGAGVVYVAESELGNLYRIEGGERTLLAGAGAAGFADGTNQTAKFNNPQGLVLDAEGNLYVADAGNHRIRKVTPTGVVTTVAGDGTAGATDGAAAAARFNGPSALRLDADGHLLIADTENHAIRHLNLTTLQVTTLAGAGAKGHLDDTGKLAKFDTPMGLATGAGGVIYVGDFGNARLRKIAIETAP